jgi:N-acetylmuramoyl-L-alanine amidase
MGVALPALLAFFLCIFPSLLHAEEPSFHKVAALEGETPTKLLERYQLHTSACNRKKFYELNEIQGEACLIAGRTYTIPVLIFTYNGRSIRSTLGLDDNDWDRAVRIKTYNETILSKRLRRKTIYDSNILWVPWHELHCADEEPERFEPAEELIPRSVAGARRYPIFGPRHEYVPLIDNRLAGKVFYIVAGHGGPDGGAIGERSGRSLCEDEYAYDVCLRLTRRLLQHGAIPYMIIRDPDDGLRSGEYLECDTDEYCWGGQKIPLGQKSRLLQRSDAINRLYEENQKNGVKEQYTISVHVDSRSRKERTDVFFYHHPDSRTSRKLALELHKALKKNYSNFREYHGSVSARDLHMTREVHTPTVFIELGNIRHPVDQLRFIREKNRQYVADWLFDGILNW